MLISLPFFGCICFVIRRDPNLLYFRLSSLPLFCHWHLQKLVESVLGVGPTQTHGLGEEIPTEASLTLLEADSKEVTSILC